ncbi:MFS transporter [Methylovirgula sp. 4M-Z18]|uniref:MFS transporter n=1 Tax=Methylovirgula sp. 4M-Z18 TaxID=2293567 RepID=UPI000E2EE5F9|nr:MFS transporter [Methylovirgula sp. 4M-Z18]RFB78425.1 MFS transporter [Methylovirgula sp. 4M-Z18]
MSSVRAHGDIDGSKAWFRLAIATLIASIGNVGMWSYSIVLPAVQQDFGLTRGDASVPYTVTMLCFAAGAIFMGRLADRYNITLPVAIAAGALGLGFALCATLRNFPLFIICHGVFLGFFGVSALFAPLMADISHWFERRRGVAVTVCAAGNYIAGAVWSPVLQRLIEHVGWREAYLIVGIICVVTILPLTWFLRGRTPTTHSQRAAAATPQGVSGFSPNALQGLICIAGVACCVAMSMPQVHIVAYCGDLGYGPAAGADMLALMLIFGMVSRVASGFVADRVGGLVTLLIGSVAQGAALLLYFLFDGLTSLYVISALFGLFQGGIVPSYALIIREYFPAQQAATRVAIAVSATIVGMALGGWLSGLIFDATGSYRAAFANGIAWNLLNVSLALWLLMPKWRTAT